MAPIDRPSEQLAEGQQEQIAEGQREEIAEGLNDDSNQGIAAVRPCHWGEFHICIYVVCRFCTYVYVHMYIKIVYVPW